MTGGLRRGPDRVRADRLLVPPPPLVLAALIAAAPHGTLAGAGSFVCTSQGANGGARSATTCATLGELYAATRISSADWINSSGWSAAADGTPTDFCTCAYVWRHPHATRTAAPEESVLSQHIRSRFREGRPRTRLLRGSALPRRFYGASCSQAGTIVGLRLGFNALQGTLPASLGSLEALTALDVQYNFLSGPVPASLASLSSLTELRISHNLFTSLPPSLSWLPSLSMDHMLLSPEPAAGFGASAHCSPAVCASRYAFVCPPPAATPLPAAPSVPPGIDTSATICPNCNVSCSPSETLQSFLLGVMTSSSTITAARTSAVTMMADSTASAIRVGLASGPHSSPVFVACLAAARACRVQCPRCMLSAAARSARRPRAGPVPPLRPDRPSAPICQGAGLGAGLSICSMAAFCTVALASPGAVRVARNKMRVACKIAPPPDDCSVAAAAPADLEASLTSRRRRSSDTTEDQKRVRLSWVPPVDADGLPLRGQQLPRGAPTSEGPRGGGGASGKRQVNFVMSEPDEGSSPPRPAAPAPSKSFARSRGTGRPSGLLNTLLPRHVSNRILRGEEASPEEFHDVTILFCDICGFTVRRSHRNNQ